MGVLQKLGGPQPSEDGGAVEAIRSLSAHSRNDARNREVTVDKSSSSATALRRVDSLSSFKHIEEKKMCLVSSDVKRGHEPHCIRRNSSAENGDE